jgi:subtilisin-like proprotein convertase family protein
VRIWDKAGNQQYDFGMQDLWPSSDPCNADAYGDPVVLYDQMADRWILTQFALPDPPYYECFAVSKTGTPTNNPSDWYLYSFEVHATKMNDYPKLGVWPDGYYMSANQFLYGSSWAGAGVWVFDRNAMLNGSPATFQYFDLEPVNSNYGGLLPSNLMGNTLPPAGAPNYFMSVDMDWNGADDILHIWEFHTDWNTPANSTFSLVKELVVDPFDWNFDGTGGSRNNWDIPQPDTNVELDSLSDRLMMHLWYRNYGGHESLVVSHTVDVGGTPDHAGIRWYEIRGGTVDTTLFDAFIYQQGTYAPDAHHRWMGSVAMDHVGNLAIGFSISSDTIYPGIRYAGRLASDPLGQLSQGEATIINGSGSQTHDTARWGDYSSITVDPVDDCTFWFTTEYMQTTSSADWQTRVASFKFANCSQSPDFTLSASPATQSICTGDDAVYTVDVGSIGGFSDPVTLSASGHPAGTTATFNPNPVTPPGSSTLTIGNTGSAPPGDYTIDIEGSSGSLVHTTSVELSVFDQPPAAPTPTSPADGAINVSTSPTFTWDPAAGAESYTLEIATDSGFTSVVHTATDIQGTSYTLPTPLSTNTTYYWRVRAVNPCGEGPWSAVFSFTTENLICSSPNVSIPDNDTNGVSDIVTITSGDVLQDLDVRLDISHTWIGDVIVTLRHVDTGTTVTLIDRPGVPNSTYGCNGDDIDATIDDYGPDGDAESMCNPDPAIGGRVRGGDPPSSTLLAAFNGESLVGDWELNVSDVVNAYTGQLNQWCLVPNRCVGTTSDVTDLTISKSGNDVILSWKDTGASEYKIYRTNNDPYFVPDDATNLLTTVNTSTYSENGILNDAANNYFYKVRGVDTCPPPAGYVERVGEFEFELVPGTN